MTEHTAMYFSGIQWEPYHTSWLTFPYDYIAKAVTTPCASSVLPAAFGVNEVVHTTFETGKTGVWNGGRVVSGGYLSEGALYSTKDGTTGLTCICSTPIPIGDGYADKIPLNTWCNVSLKTRTTTGVTAGLSVLAVVMTSQNKTYTFELSVADRAPLHGDRWQEMSMGFQLAVREQQLSLTEQRYDWCYLLPNHCVVLERDEQPQSVTFIIYADTAELWLDDILVSFEKVDDAIQTSLKATPSRVAVGEEFTVAYTIWNDSDRHITAVPYHFTYHPLLLAALTETAGTVDLPPNFEKTISVRFKALEGGAAILGVGGAAGVKAVTTRVECIGRGCYFGDSHSHSTESDGKTTPYENLQQYYRMGMSFNISADHNVEPSETANWNQALAQLQSEIPHPDRFLQIKATENSAIPNHAVQYFSPNRYDTPNTHEGWEEVIRKQKEDGGLTYIAHPFLKTDIQFWPILEGPTVVLPQYKEANGFEIINSQTLDYTPETIPKALEWWDRYNITGWARYFGIGNSDGHRLYELGGAYNGLLLDDLTEENIKAAFQNGNLFFTTGPQLRYTLGDVDMGSVLTMPERSGKVSLNVTAYTPHATPIEKVVVYRYAIGDDVDTLYQAGRDNALVLYERTYDKPDISLFRYNGELEVTAGEFVRVEVYAAHDPQAVMRNYQMAMSNPIWIACRHTDMQ